MSLFLSGPSGASAETVSFLIDPATIDGDNDGFITGNEFSPVGSDATVFTMLPTNNLVGFDRFLLSATNGLHFGGGGGSTLSFDFSTDQDIQLQSYTIGGGFVLGDPVFDLRDGSTVLSASNTAIAAGDTHNFASGPIDIDAGTTYTFITTTFGAGTQSFMASWDYSAKVIPVPAAAWMGLSLLTTVGTIAAVRRRMRPAA